MTPPVEHQNWEHIYLLGWYGEDGKPYLTTWEGSAPLVDVVVSGRFREDTCWGPPLWDAYAPERLSLEVIPEGVADKKSYARSRGGLYAFGWYFPDPIARRGPS